MSLDVEYGDEKKADAVSAREQRRQRRQQTSSSGEKRKTTTSEQRSDSDLKTRIIAALEKVAEQLDARNDAELATVVREESKPIASGFISLTGTVKFLRFPLVILVELLEPLLAFARIGRILYTRWIFRRQRLWDEAQAQEQGVS